MAITRLWLVSSPQTTKPLVVVGAAPYAAEYTEAIADIAASDPRIFLLGAVYDQALLDALYFHAYTYVHGHSVGGTNPSLLRAIGAGTPVIAYDVGFNREVLGDAGQYFTDAAGLARAVEMVEANPAENAAEGTALRERARTEFSWDDVAAEYEDLARRLAAGYSVHPRLRRATRALTEWEA